MGLAQSDRASCAKQRESPHSQRDWAGLGRTGRDGEDGRGHSQHGGTVVIQQGERETICPVHTVVKSLQISNIKHYLNCPPAGRGFK